MRLSEEKKKQENTALVIETDPVTRTIMKKALEGHCRVIEISPSDKIAAVYQQYLPHIVFMAEEARVIDGKDMVAEIVAYDEDAFVVVMDKEATPESLRHIKESGAKGFVMKPLQRDAIHKYLGLCDAAKEAASRQKMPVFAVAKIL